MLEEPPTPIQRLINLVARLSDLQADPVGRLNWLRFVLGETDRSKEILAGINLSGASEIVAREIVLKLKDAGASATGLSDLESFANSLQSRVTDTQSKVQLIHFLVFEGCMGVLRGRVSPDLLRDAAQAALVFHPQGKRLRQEPLELEPCLQDLIEAPGPRGAVALTAFLQVLGVANKERVAELLQMHYQALGVSKEDVRWEEEQYREALLHPRLSPVISIVMRPAQQEGSQNRYDLHMIAYVMGRGYIDRWDGERVDAETFFAANIAEAMRALAPFRGENVAVRVEFVVPTELLGMPFDQWKYRQRQKDLVLGEMFPVVVRWEENMNYFEDVQVQIRRCIKSSGVEWLPDPTDLCCPVLKALDQRFKSDDAAGSPAPASLVLCKKPVVFVAEYWAQLLYWGMAALWIRDEGQDEEVEEKLAHWLTELQLPHSSEPEERHFSLPSLVRKKRVEEAITNPFRARIHLLWENPDHFVTPTEASKISVEQKKRDAHLLFST
jgi:hypothetical protein